MANFAKYTPEQIAAAFQEIELLHDVIDKTEAQREEVQRLFDAMCERAKQNLARAEEEEQRAEDLKDMLRGVQENAFEDRARASQAEAKMRWAEWEAQEAKGAEKRVEETELAARMQGVKAREAEERERVLEEKLKKAEEVAEMLQEKVAYWMVRATKAEMGEDSDE